MFRLILILAGLTTQIDGACLVLSPAVDVCYTILPYSNVSIPDGVCPFSYSSSILLSGVLSAGLWGQLPSQCAVAMARLQCAQAYPPCSSPLASPCQSLCADAQTQCGSYYASLSSTLSLKCSASATCTALPAISYGSDNNLPALPTSTCVPYTGQLCAGVLPTGYQVYLAPGSSISVQEAFLSLLSFSFAVFPHQCATRFASWACQQALPACDTTSNVLSTSPYLSVPVPSPPCNSECQSLYDDCGFVFFSLGNQSASFQPPGGCNSTGMYPWTMATTTMTTTGTGAGIGTCGAATMDYPFYGTQFGVTQTGTAISGRCHVNNISNVQVLAATCPYPLHASTNYLTNFNGGLCTYSCPPWIYRDNYFNNIDIIMTVTSSVSFACIFSLFLTWLVFKEKRSQRFILYFLGSLVIVFASFLIAAIATRGKFSSIACQDETTQCTWNTGGWCNICVLQAILLTFGVLSGTGWWGIIAFDLGIKVFFNNYVTGERKKNVNTALTVLGFVFPWPFIIPPLSRHQFGSDSGASWCFFQNAGTLEDAYFWGVTLSIGILVSILMVGVVIQIARASINAGSSQTNLSKYIRPILFLFVFDFFIVFQLYVHFYGNDHSAALGASVVTFYECLLGPSPNSCGVGPTFAIPEGVYYMVSFTAAFVGVSVFLVYGNSDTLRLWSKLFRGLGRGTSRGSRTSNSGTTEGDSHSGSGSGAGSGRKISRASGRSSASLGGDRVGHGHGHGHGHHTPVAASAGGSTKMGAGTGAGAAANNHGHFRVDSSTSVSGAAGVGAGSARSLIRTNTNTNLNANGNPYGHGVDVEFSPLSPSTQVYVETGTGAEGSPSPQQQPLSPTSNGINVVLLDETAIMSVQSPKNQI